MKEHPILFSGEMVRAILRGDKTQTRRVVKFHSRLDTPNDWGESSACQAGDGTWIFWDFKNTDEFTRRAYPNGGGYACPYGKAGDRLWVRETSYLPHYGGATIDGDWESRVMRDPNLVKYAADGERVVIGWYDKPYRHCLVKHPSIHMPRWASRLTLEIVNVRVERVQDISEADARAEGYPVVPSPETLTEEGMKWMKPRDWFFSVWGRINDKRGYGWDVNPFVWVIEFKRI